MRRREFITLLGGVAASPLLWPRAARAQQPAMPVIGFLNGAAAAEYALQVAAFHQGLREVGYFEGRNVAVEYRWAEGHYDQLPTLAADLVQRRVAVIVANAEAAQVAKAATATIPIVFIAGFDPAAIGLVASLNRPGGNLTGVNLLSRELVAKRLELLHELQPNATIFAALQNPTNSNVGSVSRDLQAAAHTLGLQLHALYARNESDLDAVFATLAQQRSGGLIIVGDVFFNSRSEQLAALTLRHAVPAIFQYRSPHERSEIRVRSCNKSPGLRCAPSGLQLWKICVKIILDDI